MWCGENGEVCLYFSVVRVQAQKFFYFMTSFREVRMHKEGERAWN